MRREAAILLVVLLASVAFATDVRSEGAPPSLRATLAPVEATVGDALELTLTVRHATETRVADEPLGRKLGEFSVLEGGWTSTRSEADGLVTEWRGKVAVYRTGEWRLPELGVTVEADGETTTVRTAGPSVAIRSVLTESDAGEEAPLADLKPPASLRADWGAVKTAAGVLLALLVASGLAWWLVRRYADRLRARPAPDDPFHREAPDAWAYARLQELLERNLAEQGRIDEFHEELGRIVKLYLGGRFRVELMERTTAEVAPLMGQAGVPAGPAGDVLDLLERCDRAKFAREPRTPEVCREEVEVAYRIVDGTRPAREGAA